MIDGIRSMTQRIGARSRSDGPRSARGLPWTRRAGGACQATKEFTTLVEHTVDAFVESDDTAVEDVRRILHDLRKQYDDIHSEAENKEAELGRLREGVRAAEARTGMQVAEVHKLENSREDLQKKCDDSAAEIQEALTNRKVYEHMLARCKREQAIVREKMTHMEKHLKRKDLEKDQKLKDSRRMHSDKVKQILSLENMEIDVELERYTRENAVATMSSTLQTKKNAIKRRADFEQWRHEVAMEAANEAFHASAGRLRKIYAVEKLAGNCLQRIIFEQVERSQSMEDGFQKIREVTGLTDVMDIVHKFLNRDVEHEQLKNAVKEAEAKLDGLREEYERFKRDSDGLSYDPDTAGRAREIYNDVFCKNAQLGNALKNSEESRMRMRRSTVLIEHLSRWANRVAKSLSAFDDPITIEKPEDIVKYYIRLDRTTDKFLSHLQAQLSSGKVQRKTVSQAASKEYHEQARLLNDKEFLRCNCRVQASADAHRPASGNRGGGEGGARDDDGSGPGAALAEEREKRKVETTKRVDEHLKKASMSNQKKILA